MSKTKALVAVSTLIFSVFVFYFADKTVSAQTEKDRAPSFTLKLLNGGELKSTELKGKVTVLKFMASW